MVMNPAQPSGEVPHLSPLVISGREAESSEKIVRIFRERFVLACNRYRRRNKPPAWGNRIKSDFYN
jgi:hypothetical protein